MNVRVFDERHCRLGEGALWHPLRRQLFWFDILDRKLLTRENGAEKSWAFDEEVSAAGWISQTQLLIASASGLWSFDLDNGSRQKLCPLEAGNSVTRSNDGRADPWGGFWIGTMGRNAEPGAGSIYRFHQGQLRRVVAGITISNAICFAPDRGHAFYTDTKTSQIMQIPLDRSGWPAGNARVHIDLSEDGLAPDGAVTAADGTLWVAQWGAGRVAAYRDGAFVRAVDLPADHITCPAFGGNDLTTLFATSATQGIARQALSGDHAHGQTFEITGVARGLPEPGVLLL
ncbi:SMP-30/gluconolactonase/LRE family protein [uncultured Roseobacter sp.]|uniref:SMP-30/gluconolactonase/LRE family protein n=1 Tax=uncultured Roseobacter sp. TaxID=114847 RepID=UPI0026131132|nr:SMP-30/gluconolactonase/LRE family protein [uncultured Roseobacter sp.]